MSFLQSQKTNGEKEKRKNGPGHAGGHMTGKRTGTVEAVTETETGRVAVAVVMTARAERPGDWSGLLDIGHAASTVMMIELKGRKGHGHLMIELSGKGRF